MLYLLAGKHGLHGNKEEHGSGLDIVPRSPHGHCHQHQQDQHQHRHHRQSAGEHVMHCQRSHEEQERNPRKKLVSTKSLSITQDKVGLEPKCKHHSFKEDLAQRPQYTPRAELDRKVSLAKKPVEGTLREDGADSPSEGGYSGSPGKKKSIGEIETVKKKSIGEIQTATSPKIQTETFASYSAAKRSAYHRSATISETKRY